MHIALFHDLPSGGAKRTLHELVRRLARRHRIDLFTLTTADEQFCDIRPWMQARREFAFTPARLFRRPFGRLNQLQRWRDLQRLVEVSARIAAAIDAQGCDVLFAEPCMWTQAPLVLLHTATPSIYHCHEPARALYEPGLNRRRTADWRRPLDGIDPLIALYRRRALRLDRQATTAARRVLVNSRFTRDCVRTVYGVEAHVLYRGVDVERFQPPANGRRSRDVLSVGALQPSKGFDFLIASLAHIAAGARPRLRLVGNSEAPGERAYLMRCAARHGVELVIEIGVDDASLARRYAEAALLVYAPLREPFGLAPLEAMACATPVVGVAEGGIPESVVHDETGRLVERDPRRFAATVVALLDDEATRRRLGANGRALVCRQWTWDAAVARLEHEFTAVAGKPAPASPLTGIAPTER